MTTAVAENLYALMKPIFIEFFIAPNKFKELVIIICWRLEKNYLFSISTLAF
jgi:hypothetical protein